MGEGVELDSDTGVGWGEGKPLPSSSLRGGQAAGSESLEPDALRLRSR